MKNLLDSKTYSSLFRLLRESKRIVLCAHRSPDGDAIGSCLGWAEYLRSLGKSVRIIMPDPFPDFLKFLPGQQTVIFYDRSQQFANDLIAKADLICCLDFNDLSRLLDMGKAIGRARAERLLIDHHLDPTPDVAKLQISFPGMSSTSELVFHLISQLGGLDSLTQQGATALYTGMMTDTGAFAYGCSYPDFFLVVAQLLEKGIDKDAIYNAVFHSYRPSRLKFMGYVFDRKQRFLCDDRVSLFTLTRQDMLDYHYIRGDAEGFVNMPEMVKGLKLSISLREDTKKDIIRVSLRSVGDFPCNEMAEKFFNGGGHKNASGGQLPFPMEEAEETVEKAVAHYAPLLSGTPQEPVTTKGDGVD